MISAKLTKGKSPRMVIQNKYVKREWNWNEGRISTRSIVDVQLGLSMHAEGVNPDLTIPGITDSSFVSATFTKTMCAETPVYPKHIEVCVESVYKNGSLRQVFKLAEESPAISMTLWMKSAKGVNEGIQSSGDSIAPIENVALLNSRKAAQCPVMDRIPVEGAHWSAKAVEFYAVTDLHNNLVTERDILVYRRESKLAGNLLFLDPFARDKPHVFIVKEAPCGVAQLDWQGYDFATTMWQTEVRGCGFTDEEISGWVRGYGCAVGVYADGELNRLTALRTYQKTLRRLIPMRDNMVMMNTWGDRGQDGRLCEQFALAELDVAQKLGITHFQLDDGWQKGRSHNSKFEGGKFPDLAKQPDFWEAHPERFPNGLKPIIERGKKNGVEVCLWFNPSSANDYASWKADAKAMIKLYKNHGVTVFKIDGVMVESKRGEMNLRSMFDAVVEATNGAVVFNLDVTAGRRFGYHYFTEYGNIFLENRYTDWSNYYPTWTFRNIWQLAKYVPAERIQVEFLNTQRNPNNYAADDELAPAHVPFETAMAMTLAAQPLAWFEGTGLAQDEHFETAQEILAWYVKIVEVFHNGIILPVGEEPNGRSFAGFQSISPSGMSALLVVREASDEKVKRVKVNYAPGTELVLDWMMGNAGAEKPFKRKVDADGCIRIGLKQQWSFGLWLVELA